MKKTGDELDAQHILNLFHLKITAPRLRVLSLLAGKDRAVSVLTLTRKMKDINPATLYKIIRTLEAGGVVYKIPDSRGIAHYAIDKLQDQCNAPRLHLHFNCLKCNKVYFLNQQNIPSVSISNGFVAERYVCCLNGTCAKCAKKEVVA